MSRCVFYDGRTMGWPMPETRCTYPPHDGPHSFEGRVTQEASVFNNFSLWRLIKDAINYWRNIRANP